jgi:N-acyl-D-aspartate/D-glutamate deacylase
MVGFGMDEAGTELVLRWRHAMVASDGGAYSPASASRPHPRAYGTFPRAIRVYALDRKVVALPEMIRKMTSLPAATLGLRDRGVLAEGKAADIVVFDPASIRDEATYMDPHRFPSGMSWVIVNGVEVVREGRQQDVLPGRVLRSGAHLS